MQEGCLRNIEGNTVRITIVRLVKELSQYNSGTTATVGNIGKTNQKQEMEGCKSLYILEMFFWQTGQGAIYNVRVFYI